MIKQGWNRTNNKRIIKAHGLNIIKDLETDDIIESISEVIPLSKNNERTNNWIKKLGPRKSKIIIKSEDGFINETTIKILE